MTTQKTHPAGMSRDETDGLKKFTVLYMEGFEFKREKAEGKVIAVAKPKIEIATPHDPDRFFVYGLSAKHYLYSFHFYVSSSTIVDQ